MTNESELIRLNAIASMMFFTRYFFKSNHKKKFVVNWHHELIAQKLDDVYNGKIKRLLIRMPPRYGKTELAVKNFIAKGLAINPSSKFIHLSYSTSLALDNSEEIRDFIQTKEYSDIFPYVQVSKSSKAKNKWYTTSKGGVYATATGGQITGFGAGEVDEDFEDELNKLEKESLNKFAGAIVIDDPLKPDDANSDLMRERVNNRFENTIRSRTNSRNTPIIIIGQALHENDLIGYLLENEPDEWELLTLPALITDEQGNETALWEHKHSLDELHNLRYKDERVFASQYQQEPKDLQDKLFAEIRYFTDLEAILHNNDGSYCYVDVADEGGDYLSAPICMPFQKNINIVDVVYTQKNADYTIPTLVQKFKQYKTRVVWVETNGGGALFVKLLEKALQDEGVTCDIRKVNNSTNKMTRILNHAVSVLKHHYFRKDADFEYVKFITDLQKFSMSGNNKNDDAPDSITGLDKGMYVEGILDF